MKPKTPKTPKTPKLKAIMPMPTDEKSSVRIEKISNGYLAHHETSGPKGWKQHTVFHPEKPVLQVAVVKPKKPGK